MLSIENYDVKTYFKFLGKINNVVDEHADATHHSIFMLEKNATLRMVKRLVLI